MPFLLPVAVGGLALYSLARTVRAAREAAQPGSPEEAAHRAAVAALREARQSVRERARTFGQRQQAMADASVRPYRELLERLERWELLPPACTPGTEARARLDLLCTAPAPRSPLTRALRGPEGAGAVELLAWLERGWLSEGDALRVDGVPLFDAVAVDAPEDEDAPPPEHFARAADDLAHARRFVLALDERLAWLALHTEERAARAAAHLAYLDPASFEDAGAQEPRERLGRLCTLMDELTLLLAAPLLTEDGTLCPLPRVEAHVLPAGTTG